MRKQHTRKKQFARFVTNAMAVIGFLLAYIAAGTSDMYTHDLGARAPEYVTTLLVIGGLLMLPATARVLFSNFAGRR